MKSDSTLLETRNSQPAEYWPDLDACEDKILRDWKQAGWLGIKKLSPKVKQDLLDKCEHLSKLG